MQILQVISANSKIPLAEIRVDDNNNKMEFIVDNTNGKLPEMVGNEYRKLLEVVESSSHLRLIFDSKSAPGLLRYLTNAGDVIEITTDGNLLRGHHQTRGSAFVRSWMTPETFIALRGKWTFTQKWGIPADLPSQFKLIRMRLDGHWSAFPLKEMDVYGWELQYHHFNDRLAALFAHELHHFRRHHLGLHTREGEHAANRWALEHVQNLGYNVICTRRVKRKKHRSLRSSLIKRNTFLDPYASFRKLYPGDRLIIVHDPRKKYQNDVVTVMRGIRSNSKRIVIQTSDKQIWRWPMNWLKIPIHGRS